MVFNLSHDVNIVALKPKSSVKIVTEKIDGRYRDKLVTASSPRINIEYFIELPRPGMLGNAVAAVMFAFRSPQDTRVGPRLLLQPKLSWDEAFTFHSAPKENHNWLQVCITLSQAQFSPWLKDHQKAVARVEYWYKSGDYEPGEFHKIAWFSAASWPIWRRKKLTWKECALDLQEKLKIPLLGSTTASFESGVAWIRKMNNRLGLKRDW